MPTVGGILTFMSSEQLIEHDKWFMCVNSPAHVRHFVVLR